MPFENSSNGPVIFTLDLFADANGRYPDISVCGEVYLAVHHCLLGRASPSSESQSPTEHPSSTQSQVKNNLHHLRKLYSHPQAWGQCKRFLASTPHLKSLERQDVSSTSRAAELVAQDTSGTSAAISSRIAADLNHLDVLAEGIEDNAGNSTRFFVIRRRRRQEEEEEDVPAPSSSSSSSSSSLSLEEEESGEYKTLVSVTVEHGEPGALADCLAVFKKHRLNLTSTNARPSGETPWHYIFLIEFMGRKRGNGAVSDALRELEKAAKSVRWLGSWKNKLVQ